jgi:glyoxalase family protein
VLWRVGSADSLQFWADRLSELEVAREFEPASVRFADPEGLEHELVV